MRSSFRWNDGSELHRLTSRWRGPASSSRECIPIRWPASRGRLRAAGGAGGGRGGDPRPGDFPRGIDDSKALPAPAREAVYARLVKVAAWGVGIASVEEIDRLNIY